MLRSALGEARVEQVKHLRARFGEALLRLDVGLVEAYPIEDYIRSLDQWERRRGYYFVPPELDRTCAAILASVGVAGLEIYHRLVLLAMIADFDGRRARHRIPDSIAALIRVEFERILSSLEQAEEGFFLLDNDLFLKDLGLCRLKLLPCGPEVVDIWSGIPRRTLLQGGPRQFIECARFLRRLGGFGPYYDSHWDRRLVRQFTEANYERLYERVAELLRLNPEIKGFCGGSWWFDPEVAEISPELDFLSRTPLDNGARLFRVGTSDLVVTQSLKFSRRRREVYEAGRYRPCGYLMVWGRADLLEWARRRDFAHDDEADGSTGH